MINCGIQHKHISLFLPHRGVRAGEGKSVPTASNAAYGVVSHDLQSGGGGGDVAMYEMVGQPPSATPTAHTTSTHHHPRDLLTHRTLHMLSLLANSIPRY